MDLTKFMNGSPAAIWMCAKCGTLHRWGQPAATYESDRYDAVLLRHLYPRYVQAFEAKRLHYQPLLPPHAAVLEIGSHTGAFLEAAETWGWKPIGLDIGAQTSEFARRQGATVKRVALEDYSLRLRPLDAVFIWNCFEQLGEPKGILRETRRLLARHGLAVLRVPNGDFYRRHIENGAHLLPSLGYNNLLGFPYLHGYNIRSLKRLLRAANFEPITAFATSLLTPPYSEMSLATREEWRSLDNQAKQEAASASPWIELVGRASASSAV